MDRFTRLIYSTDASIYQIEPMGVLYPKNHDDVVAAVSGAARYGLPVLSRGAGTSLAGQTVGPAIVLDYTKYMNRILEVSPDEQTARVEPGVVLDQLNGKVRALGAQFGPDVSTSNRATLGGMVGNNSAGAHSILYGMTLDHVRETRAMLSNGDSRRRAAPMRVNSTEESRESSGRTRMKYPGATPGSCEG
jgi:FAD/FMN-containing dehydrogenase